MPDASRTQQRTALLGQLRHLIDEAEMLRHVLPRVPEPLQQARPREDAPSLKETLALLAHLDQTVRLPALTGQAAAVTPGSHVASGSAHALAASALIDTLVEARSALVAEAERLDAAQWEVPTGGAPSVYEYLFAVVQEDAEYLRALTQHLFDAQGLGA